MKLSRNPDGSYRGTYKGYEFTVQKTMDAETTWTARSGSFMHEATGPRATREGAVRGLTREIDMSLVNVPEIDAVLKRWAEQIKAIVPMLNDRDMAARVEMESISFLLTSFETSVRRNAVHFEERIAKLRARVEQSPAQKILPAAE